MKPPLPLRSLSGGWPALLLVAGIPLILVSWLLVSRSATGNLAAQGGHYVEGVVGAAPDRLNPLFAPPSGAAQDVAALVFSGLTRPGPDGEPLPDLAKSWVASPDGTSFTFLLREDAQWHDGEPFTAADVAFTAQAFTVPGTKGDPAIAEVWRQAHVQALGPYAVLFQFDSPFVPFLAYSSAGILPQHLLGRDSPAQLVDDRFNQHPIGTGPFRFRSQSAKAVELVANAAYYLGAPYIQRLTLRFVADPAALLTALRSRAVDGGILPPSLSPTNLDSLRASGHILIGGLRPAYGLVYFNLNLAQFQDPAVRQALNRATDRNRLVQLVLAGEATPADVPLPPGTLSDTGRSSTFDPAAARQALQQAGWGVGADGVMRRRGISLSFTLQTTADPQRTALANELSREWRAIGVDAKVQPTDEKSLLSDVLLPHKYEAVLYGWDPGPDPDPFSAWHSAQQGDQSGNLSGYTSAQADQLLEAARGVADFDQRAAIYGQFAQVFRQDSPALILFFPRYVYAVPQGMAGLQLGLVASPSDRFADVEQWSLSTRHK